MKNHSLIFKSLFSLSLLISGKALFGAAEERWGKHEQEKPTPGGELEGKRATSSSHLDRLKGLVEHHMPDRTETVLGVAAVGLGQVLKQSDYRVVRTAGLVSQLAGVAALVDDQLPGGIRGALKWARASNKERADFRKQYEKGMVANNVTDSAMKKNSSDFSNNHSG